MGTSSGWQPSPYGPPSAVSDDILVSDVLDVLGPLPAPDLDSATSPLHKPWFPLALKHHHLPPRGAHWYLASRCF